MTTDVLRPVTLTGRDVELVPLAASHAPALREAVANGELWHTSIPAPAEMEREIARRH